MLPPEIIKSGVMTSLVTITSPESEEKQYKGHVNVKSKVAYHCGNGRRPPCL